MKGKRKWRCHITKVDGILLIRKFALKLRHNDLDIYCRSFLFWEFYVGKNKDKKSFDTLSGLYCLENYVINTTKRNEGGIFSDPWKITQFCLFFCFCLFSIYLFIYWWGGVSDEVLCAHVCYIINGLLHVLMYSFFPLHLPFFKYWVFLVVCFLLFFLLVFIVDLLLSAVVFLCFSFSFFLFFKLRRCTFFFISLLTAMLITSFFIFCLFHFIFSISFFSF